MTPEQFNTHERLMNELIGTTVGVRQAIEKLIPISNENLNEVGQSKQVLSQILSELEKN